MGESPRGDASCFEDGLLDYWGDTAFLEPSFESLYSDGVVDSATPSVAHTYPFAPSHLT